MFEMPDWRYLHGAGALCDYTGDSPDTTAPPAAPDTAEDPYAQPSYTADFPPGAEYSSDEPEPLPDDPDASELAEEGSAPEPAAPEPSAAEPAGPHPRAEQSTPESAPPEPGAGPAGPPPPPVIPPAEGTPAAGDPDEGNGHNRPDPGEASRGTPGTVDEALAAVEAAAPSASDFTSLNSRERPERLISSYVERVIQTFERGSDAPPGAHLAEVLSQVPDRVLPGLVRQLNARLQQPLYSEAAEQHRETYRELVGTLNDNIHAQPAGQAPESGPASPDDPSYEARPYPEDPALQAIIERGKDGFHTLQDELLIRQADRAARRVVYGADDLAAAREQTSQWLEEIQSEPASPLTDIDVMRLAIRVANLMPEADTWRSEIADAATDIARAHPSAITGAVATYLSVLGSDSVSIVRQVVREIVTTHGAYEQAIHLVHQAGTDPLPALRTAYLAELRTTPPSDPARNPLVQPHCVDVLENLMDAEVAFTGILFGDAGARLTNFEDEVHADLHPPLRALVKAVAQAAHYALLYEPHTLQAGLREPEEGFFL